MRETVARTFLENERRFVQNIMRGGLALSVLMMSLGILIHLLSGDLQGQGISMWSLFRAELTAADFLLTAGIFVLALTPAFRVIMLLILWAIERDWRFVGVATLVMATLLASMGLGGH